MKSAACSGRALSGRSGDSRREILRRAMNVGEVAAASAGDEDLLPNAIGVIEQRDAAAAPAGLNGAHKSRGACADDDRVEVLAHCLERSKVGSASLAGTHSSFANRHNRKTFGGTVTLGLRDRLRSLRWAQLRHLAKFLDLRLGWVSRLSHPNISAEGVAMLRIQRAMLTAPCGATPCKSR